MIDVQAFLMGMKPALYGNTSSPTLIKHLDKLVIYPCINDKIAIFDGEDFFLFFQTEEMKQVFLTKVDELELNSAEFHELLGNTLGYPPLAARFYGDCFRLKHEGKDQSHQQLIQYRVSIRYAGIRCTSHIGDLKQNVEWIWDRYADSKALQVLVNTKYYSVERNDITKLESIIELKLTNSINLH